MDESQKKRVRKVLTPLLMCSVAQRYELFYLSKTGNRFVSQLNFEGSIFEVIDRVVVALERFGRVGEFLNEFEKFPKHEWYKE